jgi:hypothetical protein
MHVYKFMERQYVDGFLSRGTLRIGTSEEYRVPDQYDDGRSDDLECATRFAPGAVTLPIEQVPALAHLVEEGRSVNLQFVEGSGFISFSDFYLFCASRRLTTLMVKRMADTFGADACVRISNLKRFAEIITGACEQFQSSDKPNFEVNTFYGGEVRYRDYDERLPKAFDPMEKRTKFRWQQEFRLIWPGAAPRKGFVVSVPGICGLLKEVDLTPYR